METRGPERLDPSFVSIDPKNYRKFFKKGKVFRTLWPEPANSTEKHRNGAYDMGGWGERMIVKIHWFVVVQTWGGHCLVVPVHTYDGRGATKSGINVDDHCALVAKGKPQVALDGEQLRRDPLHLILENSKIELKPSSRINFAKFYTVEYNIKISTVGRIAPEDVLKMGMYWHQSITKTLVDNPPIRAYQEAENQRKDILNWLSTTHSSEAREPETGEWLLACPEYQTWLESPGSTLFCPGLPGTGKTMITSVVANHLRGLFREDPNFGVCYVRCDDFRGKNKILHLLFLLVKQLMQKRREFFDLIADVKRKFEMNQRRPQHTDLFDILKTLIAGLSRTFIILDAVDELEGSNDAQQTLLRMVLDLQVGRRINLLATSRFTPYVTKMFRGTPTKEIHGEQNVRIYLDRRISRLPDSVKQLPDLQQQIRSRIEQAADGSFLLATTLLDFWAGKMSVEEIRDSLKTEGIPPKVLRTAWFDRVHRVVVEPRGYRGLARRALLWVARAQWPLTGSELQHALAVEPDSDVLRPEDIPSLEAILSACAGFLSIESGTGRVRLVPESAKEYLLRPQWSPDAHETIAEACATYLLLDQFADGHSRSDKELQDRFQSFPLYSYAAWNWGYHAQLSSVTPYMKRAVQRLVERPAHVQAWHQSVAWYNSGLTQATTSQIVPGNVTVLHTAAFLDLENFIFMLLDTKQLGTEVKDGQGRTPLSYAAERGSHQAVQVLVEHHANIESKDMMGLTPLLWALRYKHDSVVRLLLKILTKKSSRCRAFGIVDRPTPLALGTIDRLPPLSFASRWGLLDSVQGLLEAKVTLDERDEEYQRTALIWAAMNGHTDVVQELLKKNADRNIKDSSGRSALSMASWMGFESIVRLLLDFWIDCETEDDEGEQPLWQTENQRQDGIDVEAIDKIQHRSALSLAAEGGHLSIVQLLLDRGAEPQSQSIVNQTPLFFAADNGHIDIVELLLEKGVHPCPLDNFNQTPQDRATLRGENLIQYRLGIIETTAVKGLSNQSGTVATRPSMPVPPSKSQPSEPPRGLETDKLVNGKTEISGLLFKWLTDSLPSASLDEPLKSKSDQLLLLASGVKHTIVRFLFDYDDNELHNEFQAVWHPDRTTADYRDMSRCVSEHRHTAIDAEKKHLPDSRDHHTSVIITRATVDEDEIFGMKLEAGQKATAAIYRTGTNLFNAVKDALLSSVQTIPPGHVQRIKLLVDSGMLHLAQYQETKSLTILEEGISRTRQALKEFGQNQAMPHLMNGAEFVHRKKVRVVALANLGIQLDHLYRRTSHSSILDEAIESMRQAISETSHLQRHRLIPILGVQLRDRYAKTGDVMDLDEAIRLTQEANASLSAENSLARNRVAVLNNFASLLADRFAEIGHGDDGQRALSSMREAIGMMDKAPDTEINTKGRAAMWHNLSSLCTEIFLRDGDLPTLDDAVHYARKASEIAPNNCTERAVVLSHYAILLCIGCERHPKKYHNLDEAVDVAQKAATLTQAGLENANRAAVLYNLGSAYLYRWFKRGQSKDRDKAVLSMREAIDGTLQVHTDLRMINNHSKIRFGNEHCTMNVLHGAAGILNRSQWYFRVSGQILSEKKTFGHSGIGSNDNWNRSTKRTNPRELVTEEVIKAAAGYMENSEEILKRLLRDWGPSVVTEKAVKAAAGNIQNGEKVLEILLDTCGETIPITEEVVEAAAGNWDRGDKVMDLLYQRKPDRIVLTDAIIRAAVKNETTGSRILVFLVHQPIRGLKRKRGTFDGQLDQEQLPVTRAPAHRYCGPQK